MVIDMSKCTMKIADSPVNATLHLSTPISDPNIRATIETSLDVASLRDVMPLEKDDKVNGTIKADVAIAGHLSTLEKGNYDDFKADGSIEIKGLEYATGAVAQTVRIPSAELIFSPKALNLRSFDLMLGESDLSLSGSLENYLAYYLKGKELRGNLKVSSQNIDLTSLMASADPDEGQAAQETTEEAAAPAEALKLPANIRFDTSLDLKKLTYGTIRLSDIKGHLGLYDQIAYLQGISVGVADGSATASGHYNAKNPKTPRPI